MTNVNLYERKALVEKACIQFLSELDDAVKDFINMESAHSGDDLTKIYNRMLFITSTERELSYIYRKAKELKRQVEINLSNAKEILDDAKARAIGSPNFKSLNSYESRPEVEAKIRSMTIEETHEVLVWERLLKDAQHVLDILYSHQQDAIKERRDIDTRIKIVSMIH